MKLKRLRNRGLIVPLALLGLFGLGYATAKLTVKPAAPKDNGAAMAAKYPLLSRRVFLDSPNDTLINFVPLRKAVQDKLSPLTTSYSFTFEYLPTGTTIRSGDGQELVGASLIKLPVVMDLYRASEAGKVNLDEEETLTEDELNDQFGDLYKRGAGAKLTLREAAKYALSQSDNTAILTIQKRLKNVSLDTSALDAVDADFNAEADQVLINSKSYSSVLKCLYYACYINRDDSQELLNYLTESDFNAGIAKPIPEGTTVAHKIGVQANKLSQSDCGIIYLPKRPYLLCVMLGLPEDQANSLMSDLSDTIYKSLTSRE